MPQPPRKGESKQDWISRCAGSSESVKEFPDQKQRLAYCYSVWERKKAKAAHVITTASDETIFTESTFLLSEALIAKVATLPKSGADYHNVIVTLKDGSTRDGMVVAGQDFVSYDDCDEMISDDIVDLKMSDTA